MTNLLFRAAQVQPADVDRESRSLPLILATESPVQAYEMGRGVVTETLRVGGMDLPAQVPMLDTHNRDSVQNVLGSIRELKRDGDRIVGRAFFASDPVSKQAFENYADGHLTDFSVGARRDEVEYQDGDKRIVTRSTLIEGSAVVRGADPSSKAVPVALRAYTDPFELREEIMLKEIREDLVKRGLPQDATDTEMVEWINERADKADGDDLRAYTKVLAEVENELKRAQPGPPSLGVTAAEIAEEKAIERTRVNDINALCRDHVVEAETHQGWIDSDILANECARQILAKQAPTGTPTGPGTRIEGGLSEREKFYEAARHGILTRALGSLDRVAECDKEDVGEANPDSRHFRYTRVADLAREFLNRAGERVTAAPDADVIRQAMGVQGFVERDGPSFHTTGSFANLYLDAMHKTLRVAYDESPTSYQTWVRQAASAADYKSMHRIQYGEVGLAEQVPENFPYPEQTSSDVRENYKVEKHGGIYSISLEMLVNDDLDAMTRIPRMQGNAMARTINRDAYKLLNDNAALADGIELFHASSHGANLDGTALAEGALDTGYNVMMTQTGLDPTAILNLRPRYMLVASGLAATAYRLVNAGIIPETVANVPLYGPTGQRPLEVIVDAEIDNNASATAWYLAADTSVIDTVEITFLQGEESPTVDREDGFATDTIKYKIRQSYGMKAIDFRGLYQGNT